MAYADLAEVQRLPTNDVRRLCNRGDPRERVWAAWALGLRGPAQLDWIARCSREDPVPGVRRHLVVVLAGFNRTGDLWVLADDTDVRVRATALHWLARLSDEDDLATWDRIMLRFHRDGSEVRAAVLRALPARLPRDVAVAWPAALDDPAADVRQAALDRVKNDPEMLTRFQPRLRRRLEAEADRTLRRALMAILGVVEPRPAQASLYPLMCVS